MTTEEFIMDEQGFGNVLFLKLVGTFIILIMGVYYALNGIYKL